MTMYGIRYFFGRSKARRAMKATAGLLGIAMLGYVAITLVEHTLPLLNASSGFAVESRMASQQPATAMANAPRTSGVATPSVPAMPSAASAAPEVAYFPRGYVNRATTVEEQSPTF
jgi:hypothetical protein